MLLGLGLSWVTVAIYTHIKCKAQHGGGGVHGVLPGGVLLLPGRGALGLLCLKRCRGGELGGRTRRELRVVALLLFGLWFLFLVLSGACEGGHFESEV